MTKQSQITFTIDRNKRHQVQIENIAVDKEEGVTGNILFKKEYEQVLDVVKNIIEIQNKDEESEENDKRKSETVECPIHTTVRKNNILLFTGQRGSGKTSAVTSIGRYLERNKVNEKQFKCLPMIDPSYFDNSNSILKSVLMTMFRVAKCVSQAFSKGGNSTNYTGLWKRFDKAFKVLGDIEREKIHDYSLETLNELGEASSLRDTMQDLLNEFIRTVPDKCDYLVLMIDDLDMNVSYAAQMLEQMRKFLMLDKLIILVAANLDQLQNEMREFYSKSFQQTLKETNQTLSVDVEDLATRYLLKVFPASRRIHLSNVTNSLTESDLHIIDKSITQEEFQVKYGEYHGKRLQQVILTMIWERTRLLFVPKNTSLLHPIIPSNLRVLSQFVNFLLDMKKVDCNATEGMLFKDLANYSLCQQNFTKFKNYILNNWISEKVTYEQMALFEDTPHDVSEINKHFINAINVIGTKNKKRLMSREVDLEQIAKNAEGVNIDRDIYTMVSPNDPRFVKANKISDIFNQPSNYSYGDLLLMIDKYETYFESEEDRRFINAIKIYYSIILFETMFFKSTGVKYDKDDMKDVNLSTIIPIQKLLGGTVYYPNYFEIVTSEFFKQKGPSFDAKRAFYHKLTHDNELDEIKTLFKKRLRSKTESRARYAKEIKSKIAHIRENSKLMFFILYYGDVRPDRYDSKHIYDTTMEEDSYVNGRRYMIFDLLSIFNNVLNPLHTIFRNNGDASKNVNTYNKHNVFFNGLIKWKKLCFADDSVSFPGSLLPFYSIDMMLMFLRKPVNDMDILAVTKLERKELKIRYTKLNNLSSFVEDYSYNNIWTYNDVKTLISQLLSSSRKRYKMPKDIAIELENNFAILKDAYKLYVASLEKDEVVYKDTALNYQNRVIDIIFKEYNGTKKERDNIIKRIHDYNTISEVYNYLTNALWVDVIKERIIRAEVQNQIRQKSSILNYFNKLWCLTSEAINRVVYDEVKEKVVCADMEKLYEKIYNTGVEVFIDVK